MKRIQKDRDEMAFSQIFDFFAPKTNPAPSIPTKEKEIVPMIKLMQIVPITLILISKNNAITGKIIINGRPTETQ